LSAFLFLFFDEGELLGATFAEAEVWVGALPEECAHRICFVQPRGEDPLQGRFPLAIASNTAHLPATFPQEVFVKILQRLVG